MVASQVLLGCTLRDLLGGTLARQLAAHAPPGAPPLQLYLAQSPILVAPPGSSGSAPTPTGGRTGGGGAGGGGREGGPAGACGGGGMQHAPLAPLMADLEVPAVLQGAALTQVNFWASVG